jgi:hypothetical protein
LPHFDSLVFTFTNSTAEAVQALLAGECDLADEASLNGITTNELEQLKSEANLFTGPGGAWEQILFGITPASETRPAIFSSTEVRQAVATCIDRERIIDQLYPGMSFVPDSFVLPDHPLYQAEGIRYIYDPQAASDKLAASGWIDHDDDPGTPRLSQGVAGFQDGTPFEFSYLASNDPQREQAALMVQSDLAGCGIQMNLTWGKHPKCMLAGRMVPYLEDNSTRLNWPGQPIRSCHVISLAAPKSPVLFQTFPKDGEALMPADSLIQPTTELVVPAFPLWRIVRHMLPLIARLNGSCLSRCLRCPYTCTCALPLPALISAALIWIHPLETAYGI